MNDPYESAFQTIGDSAGGWRPRVDAAQLLGATGEKRLVPRLQKLLRRQRPPDRDYIDYDPRAAERVVDIAVVGALHQLGDNTHVDYLFRAVSTAGGGAGQPIKESQLAGETIRRHGWKAMVERFVQLCGDKSEQTVTNAVRTLVAVQLPQPATHQPCPDAPVFRDQFKITPRMLGKYFDDVQKSSRGHLRLSPDVQARIKANDYQMSDGEQEEISLTEVLNEEIILYGFAYLLEDQRATICTFAEAGQRWQAWWKAHGDKLVFSKEHGRFELKE